MDCYTYSCVWLLRVPGFEHQSVVISMQTPNLLRTSPNCSGHLRTSPTHYSFAELAGSPLTKRINPLYVTCFTGLVPCFPVRFPIVLLAKLFVCSPTFTDVWYCFSELILLTNFQYALFLCYFVISFHYLLVYITLLVHSFVFAIDYLLPIVCIWWTIIIDCWYQLSFSLHMVFLLHLIFAIDNILV